MVPFLTWVQLIYQTLAGEERRDRLHVREWGRETWSFSFPLPRVVEAKEHTGTCSFWGMGKEVNPRDTADTQAYKSEN